MNEHKFFDERTFLFWTKSFHTKSNVFPVFWRLPKKGFVEVKKRVCLSADVIVGGNFFSTGLFLLVWKLEIINDGQIPRLSNQWGPNSEIKVNEKLMSTRPVCASLYCLSNESVWSVIIFLSKFDLWGIKNKSFLGYFQWGLGSYQRMFANDL